MKVCPKCDTEKELDQFNKRGGDRGDAPQSWCKSCAYARGRVWVDDNREEVQTRDLARWHSRSPEAKRNSHLKRMYGITFDEYLDLVEEQNGECLICEHHFGTDLCVDHHHSSGRIRGLLCRHCNSSIGLLKDDHEIILRASEYVRTR
ncbi:MAG: hypothetical protein GY906_23260 [bacterium]|nr:hypothetical protein [bacterium]